MSPYVVSRERGRLRVVAESKPNDAVAEVGGVNVHASAAVPSRDRQRLERLCRYVARPPLAQDRLELTADGRVDVVEVGLDRPHPNAEALGDLAVAQALGDDPSDLELSGAQQPPQARRLGPALGPDLGRLVAEPQLDLWADPDAVPGRSTTTSMSLPLTAVPLVERRSKRLNTP